MAAEHVVQHATYYDTTDLRLVRAGASLRFRSDDGWTVKLPERRDHDALIRSEHTFGGDPDSPPANALGLVRALSRTQPVVEVARVHTHRRRTILRDGRGEALAEVDDDDVVGRDVTTGSETRFREVEVELGQDAPDDLIDAIVKRLRHAGARRARASSKIERVLGPKAATPDDLPRVRVIKSNARVRDLVRNTLARSVTQLLTMDPQLRLTDDDEAVHKARVAARRLRSDLRTFRSLLDRGWSEPLRAELTWLGTILGHVRDADVLLAALGSKAAELPDSQHAGVEPLLQQLRSSRLRHRDALRDALDSTRYAQLLERLVAASIDPPLRDGVARRPARKEARRLARKPQRRLRRAARGLDEGAPDADLHEVRKRAKQARYAHEALIPILGKPARRAAKRFEAVQEVLGDHQDAVVAATWLHDAAHDTDRSEEAFSAGELAGLFLSDRLSARNEWLSTWKRARKAEI